MKRLAMQVFFYGIGMLLIGYLSANPLYRHQHPDTALIRLSFSHAGERREDCRQLSPAEIAALPPNMRRPTQCKRARVDLAVELEMDGLRLFQGRLPPSGLAGDGASTVYRRFVVSPGRHALTARLRDSRRSAGFDHEKSAEITLSPGENFVIDFSRERGGFVFLGATTVAAR